MLDYSLPVAKRTRSKHDEACMDAYHHHLILNKNKKINNKNERVQQQEEDDDQLLSNSNHHHRRGFQSKGTDQATRFNCDSNSEKEVESCLSDYDNDYFPDYPKMCIGEEVVEKEEVKKKKEKVAVEEDSGYEEVINRESVKRKRKYVVSESEDDEVFEHNGINNASVEDFACIDLTLDSNDDIDVSHFDEVDRLSSKRNKPYHHLKNNCVAKRTRSNFASVDNRRLKCKPVVGDKDEKCATKTKSQLKSAAGGKDEKCATETKSPSKSSVGHIDKQCIAKIKSSSTAKIGSKKVKGNEKEFVKLAKKNVRKHTPTIQRVLKILADSLLDKKSHEENSSESKTELKEIFFFGEEEEIVPEKSNTEKEIDDLFAEMDFVLKCSEIGSSDPMVEDDNEASSLNGHNQNFLCCKGKQLKLDEEIGLVCKSCGHVELEIRYIVPAFFSKSRKRADYRYNSREDNSFNGFVNIDHLDTHSKPINDFNYEKGTVWDLIPGTKQSLYRHQREGFEFIWNNVAGEFHLDKLNNPETKNPRSGCIISHVPGTGKSRLTLVFLQSYMKLFPNCKPVIVAPRSMLLTWEEEFKKWKVDIPFHILNISELSGNESEAATGLRGQSKGPRVVRLMKLYSWKTQKSVLGISYMLFEKLAGDSKNVFKGYEYEKIKTMLLNTPDLFIFDEGHTPRNETSGMFKALFQIKTEKRIILSGTPFQNNFKELYNTLRLVRPNFTDKMLAKRGRGGQKRYGPKSSESKRKWTSLTDTIGLVSGCQVQNPSIEELRATIAPFVHIHKGNILKQTLKELRISVLILQPGSIQKSLLDTVEGSKYALKDDCAVSLLSVHPSLLHVSIDKQALVDRYKLQDLRLKPEAGVKTRFLIELIRLSTALNEKVLVFGQYIEALTCIKDQLQSKLDWKEEKEILYIDGKSNTIKRQKWINYFNDPKSDARIMLASIKACGEGINLIGASRVVLLDVLWNPSVERQAISRAYRIGQKKDVYVYRLLTSGTMEEEKWTRQAKKDQLSELVFCSPSEVRVGDQEWETSSRLWEDKILEEMVKHEKLENMFKNIKYHKQPKESDSLEGSD